ncbi:hypothetical protein D3C72_1995790 [compost metagenome]
MKLSTRILGRTAVTATLGALMIGAGIAAASTTNATRAEEAPRSITTNDVCLRDGIAYCTSTYPIGPDRTLCIADVRAACSGA